MTIRTRACNKCGGDLYFEQYEYYMAWKCLQCGNEQEAVMVSEENPKRHYTKTDKFYKRWGKEPPEKQPSFTVKPPLYWEGYRQAVLDIAGKQRQK